MAGDDVLSAIDPVALDALEQLLSVSAEQARRIRAELPRRRARLSQAGPVLDLGAARHER